MPRHRTALTRVELLVGLIVVVLLATLILSAILKVRASADLMKCRNNLKQFGLAIHNYNDTNGRLPALADQGEGSLTGRGLPSVFFVLIPYIEASPYVFRSGQSADLYNAHSSVVFTYQHKGHPFNQVGGMANSAFPIFIDPADGTADRLKDVPVTLPDGTTGYYGAGSYAANGLLPWGARGLSSFQGQLAEVILFTERPQVCQNSAGRPIYNLWGLGIYSPNMPAFAALTPADPPGLLSTEQIAPADPLDTGSGSEFRVRIGQRDAPTEPSDFESPIQVVRRSRPCDPRLPGTPHRGVMQAVMMDGSIRNFTKDTSPVVFWSACAPARTVDEQ